MTFLSHGMGGSQYWQYSKDTNEIKQSQNAEYCADAVKRDQIRLATCHGQGGNQEWIMNKVHFMYSLCLHSFIVDKMFRAMYG